MCRLLVSMLSTRGTGVLATTTRSDVVESVDSRLFNLYRCHNDYLYRALCTGRYTVLLPLRSRLFNI